MSNREDRLLMPMTVATGAGLTLIAYHDPTDPVWLSTAAVAVVLGSTFWGWIGTHRRLQALEDIPLSKIATAAQGYTRLEGRARPLPDHPITTPGTHRPACWYEYVYGDVGARGTATTIHRQTSESPFLINDGTGECLVDPVRGKIVAVHITEYKDSAKWWTEEAILPGEKLAVIGDFRTNVAQPSRNQMLQPWDGRPYIISAEPRDDLARTLTVWSWVYVTSFVLGAAALAGWVLERF